MDTSGKMIGLVAAVAVSDMGEDDKRALIGVLMAGGEPAPAAAIEPKQEALPFNDHDFTSIEAIVLGMAKDQSTITPQDLMRHGIVRGTAYGTLSRLASAGAITRIRRGVYSAKK